MNAKLKEYIHKFVGRKGARCVTLTVRGKTFDCAQFPAVSYHGLAGLTLVNGQLRRLRFMATRHGQLSVELNHGKFHRAVLAGADGQMLLEAAPQEGVLVLRQGKTLNAGGLDVALDGLRLAEDVQRWFTGEDSNLGRCLDFWQGQRPVLKLGKTPVWMRWENGEMLVPTGRMDGLRRRVHRAGTLALRACFC